METAGKLVDDEQLKEALKERGLGTPATRAAIIETLLTRGYITRDKKTLAATDTGRYLVAIVQDRGLKSPELTGEWEAKLREIERGRLDPRQFMGEIVRYTGEVVRSGDSGDRREPARRLPALRPAGDRGEAGIRLLGLARGLPVRALATIHKERTLSDDQIRELLQRRVLDPPAVEGIGAVILHLTDPASWWRSRSRSASRRDRAGDDRPASGAGERRPGAKGRGDARPRRPRSGSPVSIGPCPLCGSEVVEQPKSYGCSGWRRGASSRSGRRSPASGSASARPRHSFGRAGARSLKGFESKSGKPFEARLKLDGGEVRFDFGS